MLKRVQHDEDLHFKMHNGLSYKNTIVLRETLMRLS